MEKERKAYNVYKIKEHKKENNYWTKERKQTKGVEKGKRKILLVRYHLAGTTQSMCLSSAMWQELGNNMLCQVLPSVGLLPSVFFVELGKNHVFVFALYSMKCTRQTPWLGKVLNYCSAGVANQNFARHTG